MTAFKKRGSGHGSAVQVQPMKSMLTAPGTQRSKQKKQQTASKSCFQIQLAALRHAARERSKWPLKSKQTAVLIAVVSIGRALLN